MRPALLIPALLTPVLLTAAAPAQDRATPALTPAGEPVGCLPVTQIRDTIVRDDRTIDFELRDRRIFRNTLADSCPDLANEGRFTYATRQSQLCALDRITVLYYSAVQRGGACALGQFQPMAATR